MIKRYIYANLLALDIGICSLFGGAPWETLSARFAKESSSNKFAAIMQRFVDWLALTLANEPHHCESALRAYLARMAAAPSFTG